MDVQASGSYASGDRLHEELDFTIEALTSAKNKMHILDTKSPKGWNSSAEPFRTRQEGSEVCAETFEERITVHLQESRCYGTRTNLKGVFEQNLAKIEMQAG